MHWINIDEKEMIKIWSVEQNTENLEKKYLTQPDKMMKSYWKNYNNDKNIMEYDFSSISELSDLLKTELTDEYFEELILPITVATFKGRTRVLNNTLNDISNNLKTEKNIDEFSIPEFVYVF